MSPRAAQQTEVEPAVPDVPAIDEADPVDEGPTGEVFEPVPAPAPAEFEDSDLVEILNPATPGGDTAFTSWGAWREVWGPKGWRRIAGRDAEGRILLVPVEEFSTDVPADESASANASEHVEMDLTADGEGISGEPGPVDTTGSEHAPPEG